MPPVTVMIKPVSGACNMRCQYCFYADEMQHRSTPLYPVMTAETLEAVVRRSMAYADGQASFVFQGGEPTLAGVGFFDLFIQLQNKYNARGIPVSNALQTNGYDLSDEMISFLAKHQFLVGVSLDGNELIHDRYRRDAKGNGTWAQVRRNIARLESAGVAFNILCVLTEDAAMNAETVLSALSGYPYLQFIPCMDALDGKPSAFSLTNQAYRHFLERSFLRYERAFEEKKALSIRQFDNWIRILLGYPPENCAMKGQCSLGFLIESSGDVFPCDFYALDEWRLGNVNHQSLRQMRRTPTASAFFESAEPPAACLACRWYGLCRNGCRRERDAAGTYRLCAGTKAFLDEYGTRLEAIAHRLRSGR